MWLQLQFNISGFESRHFSRLANETVQSVTLLIDDVKELVPLHLVESGAGKKTGNRSFHGSERSSEVMRNGVQQRGFQAFALAGCFRFPHHLYRVRPLYGNSNESAQRFERLPRQHGSGNTDAAENSRTNAQRSEADAVLLVYLKILPRDDRFQ